MKTDTSLEKNTFVEIYPKKICNNFGFLSFLCICLVIEQVSFCWEENLVNLIHGGMGKPWLKVLILWSIMANHLSWEKIKKAGDG